MLALGLAPGLEASLLAVFGNSVVPIRILQCILSAATVIFVFLLGNNIFDSRTAWLAAIGFALYPTAIYFSYELLTETLYVFLLFAFAVMSCAVLISKTPSWETALGTGLVIGLMALTRPTILFFAPFFGLWLLIVFPSLLRAVGVGACVLAGIAVVVGPWTIRNYFVHDEFVLISPVAWTVFLSGNNRVVATDPAYAGDSIWYSKVPEYSDKFDGLRQTERERVAKQLAIYKMAKGE